MTSIPSQHPTRPELDLSAILRRTWELFAAKPLEHIAAGAIVSFGGALTLGILFGPLLVSYIRFIERQRKGEPVSVSQLFQLDQGLTAFVTTVIIGLLAAVGLVLFVLPGLLVLVIWGYSYWFIAVERQGTMAAMGSSWRLLKANFGSVLVVWVILLLVHSAGAAAVVGSLLAVPLSALFATVALPELQR